MLFFTTLYVDVKEPGRERREFGARETLGSHGANAPAVSAGKIRFPVVEKWCGRFLLLGSAG
jgi:hypothetical protein